MTFYVISRYQHGVLRHCLGFDMTPRARKPHRNYYCVEPGMDGYEAVDQLRIHGYMDREKGGCFRATEAGVIAARMNYDDYAKLIEVLGQPNPPS